MFDELAGILSYRWLPHGSQKDTIIGNWSEDGSTYHITCPHQLRDSIILMQNWLYAKSQLCYDLNSELQKMKRWFNS